MAELEVTRYPLNGLAADQFFMLLLKASWALNWQMGNKGDKYSLNVPLSPESDSEMLLVSFENGVAVIERKKGGFRIGNKNSNNNVALLIAKLNEMKATYNPEQLTEEFNTMLAQQKAQEADIAQRAKTNQLTALEKIQVARGTQYVTYALIAINVLVYILMVIKSGEFWDFSRAGNLLIDWGGNVRNLNISGQWYRLITCMFLHGGLVHIAFNMYALFSIGMYLEPLLGRLRYLVVYLACGVLASLASTWFDVGVPVSVGASGAIFGLFGVFLALLTTRFVDQRMRKPMLRNIIFFVAFNLFYGTVANGIDNAAHVGGLVSGVLFGYLYYYLFISKRDNIIASAIITIVITFATVFFVLPNIKKDNSEQFIDAVSRLSELDAKADKLVQAYQTEHGWAAAQAIKTVSLPLWQQCVAALDSTQNYAIPKEYKERRDLYKRYFLLQIQHAQLMVQNEAGSSTKTETDINNLQKQIAATIDSLNKQ